MQVFLFFGHRADLHLELCGGPQTNDDVELMSINEIMHGKGEYFPGLIPILRAYLYVIDCDDETLKIVSEYIALISGRARGELLTPAQWMRSFVLSHPSYKHDSRINKEVFYDLMKDFIEISEGNKSAPELLGSLYPRRSPPEPMSPEAKHQDHQLRGSGPSSRDCEKLAEFLKSFPSSSRDHPLP
jgi:glutamate--cysteine ligase catalytic subunit